MGFVFTNLMLEAFLRDGLETIQNSIGTDRDIVSDIFSSLKASYMEKRYGERELDKIRNLVSNEGIKVTHSFSKNDPKLPLVYIHPSQDNESPEKDFLDDYVGDEDIAITPRRITDIFDAESYNSTTGEVSANLDDPNFEDVRPGMYWVNKNGNKYKIKGGISNEDGDKRFSICTGLNGIELEDGYIESGIDKSIIEKSGVISTEMVTLHVIADNPLTVTYIYAIIKYLIIARKSVLESMCISGLVTTEGDDLHIIDWDPDHVFGRRIFVKFARIENTWNSDYVDLVEAINPLPPEDAPVVSDDTDGVQIDDIGGKIRVKRDIYPRDDEDTLTVITEPGDNNGDDDDCIK